MDGTECKGNYNQHTKHHRKNLSVLIGDLAIEALTLDQKYGVQEGKKDDCSEEDK